MDWILNVKLRGMQYGNCYSALNAWIKNDNDVHITKDAPDNSFSMVGNRDRLTSLMEWIATEKDWNSAEIMLIPYDATKGENL